MTPDHRQSSLPSLLLSNAALTCQSPEGLTRYQPSQELEATDVIMLTLWHEDTVNPTEEESKQDLRTGFTKRLPTLDI